MINEVSNISGCLLEIIEMEVRQKAAVNKLCNEIQTCLTRYTSTIGSKCQEVFITQNEGEFFGVRVGCIFADTDILYMVTQPDDVNAKTMCKSYAVEIDSRLLDGFYESIEAAVLIVAEVDAFTSAKPWNEAVDVLNGMLMEMDTELNMKMIDKWRCIFNFVMKQAAYYLGSIVMKATCEEGINTTAIESPFDGMEDPTFSCTFYSAIDKLRDHTFNPGVSPRHMAATVIQWFIMITAKEDIKDDVYIIHTVTRSGVLSNSMLYKRSCNNLVRELQDIMFKPIDKSLVSEGFFANMRLKGMKSLEDDLYEWRMKMRNVATQDEALVMMRQINNNMSIIDQFIMEGEGTLTPKDIEHWRGVYNKYAELREELANKAVYDRRRYGLFVDYNTLQQIGNNGNFDNY